MYYLELELHRTVSIDGIASFIAKFTAAFCCSYKLRYRRKAMSKNEPQEQISITLDPDSIPPSLYHPLHAIIQLWHPQEGPPTPPLPKPPLHSHRPSPPPTNASYPASVTLPPPLLRVYPANAPPTPQTLSPVCPTLLQSSAKEV